MKKKPTIMKVVFFIIAIFFIYVQGEANISWWDWETREDNKLYQTTRSRRVDIDPSEDKDLTKTTQHLPQRMLLPIFEQSTVAIKKIHYSPLSKLNTKVLLLTDEMYAPLPLFPSAKTIFIYDIETKRLRVDLRLNDNNEVVYTYYYYDGDNILFTASSTNLADVSELDNFDINTIDPKTLNNGMTITIYNDDQKRTYSNLF